MKQFQFMILFIIFMMTISNVSNTKQVSLTGLSGFKCYGLTKIDSAIRLVNNKIECLSENGQDCIRGLDTDHKCRQYLSKNSNNLRTIRCTEANAKVCQEARHFFFRRWHCSSETGLNTGIRINEQSGQVECLSQNGRDCLWGTYGDMVCEEVKTCSKTQASIKTLQCGNQHSSIFGFNGYVYSKNHWCKIGFGYFYNTGRWLCINQTGIPNLLRLGTDGEIECGSTDGRNCIWEMNSQQQCEDMIRTKGSRITQLKCGVEHKKYYGESGYHKKGHWCRKGLKLFYMKRINLFGSKIQLPPHHIYRRVVRNKDLSKGLWKKIIHKLRVTKFYRIISEWSRRNRRNLNRFWNRFRRSGWRYAIKTASWWNSFNRYVKRRQINIYYFIKRFSNIVKFYRKKHRKYILKFRKFINKRWRGLKRKITTHPFLVLMMSYRRISGRANLKVFWRLVKYNGWGIATKQSNWWFNLIQWLRARNIRYKNIAIDFGRNIKRWRNRVKRVFIKKHGKGSWIRRGKRFRNGRYTKKRIIIHRRKWSKVINRIRKNPVFIYFNQWARQRQIPNYYNFWRKLRVRSWLTFIEQPIWIKFITYIRRNRIRIRRHIRKIRKILRNARDYKISNYFYKRKGFNGRISRKHWSPIVRRIKRLRLWRYFQKCARRENIKPVNFIISIIKDGWKQITKKPLWKKFIKFAIKKGVNVKRDFGHLQNFVKNLRKIIKAKVGKIVMKKGLRKIRRISKGKWKRLFNKKIRRTIFYNLLKPWSRYHKIDLVPFWNAWRIGGFRNMRNITLWWKKFVKHAKEIKISLKKHITKIKKLLRKSRVKYSWNKVGRWVMGEWDLIKGSGKWINKRTKVIPKKIFIQIEKIILKNKLAKTLIRYSHRNKNVNIKKFWKKLRRISVKQAFKHVDWWIDFEKWTQTQDIEIEEQIYELNMFVEEIREEYGEYSELHGDIIKVSKNKWERLRTNFNGGKFWDLITKFKTTVNTKRLWKRFYKYGITNGLKKSGWWTKFKIWIKEKNIPVKRLYKDFRIKLGSILKTKFRIKPKRYSRRKYRKFTRRFRKYRRIIKRSSRIRRFIKVSWTNTKRKIHSTRLWEYLNEFANEGDIDLQEFWTNIKLYGFEKGVKRISWWSDFEEFLLSRELNANKIFSKVKKIVISFRIKGNNRLSIRRKIKLNWEQTKALINNSRIWRPMLEFTIENDYDIKEFLKAIKKQGFTKGIRSIFWWSEFEDFLKQKDLPLKNIYDEIKRLLRKYAKSTS